jgi:hypothetical protein
MDGVRIRSPVALPRSSTTQRVDEKAGGRGTAGGLARVSPMISTHTLAPQSRYHELLSQPEENSAPPRGTGKNSGRAGVSAPCGLDASNPSRHCEGQR